MNKQEKEIYRAFGGKLVGKFRMKVFVCRTVALMPQEIVNFITKKCWFVNSFDDAWAFAFTGNDLKDQHLIFLSDDLLIQNANQIHYSIAHEIGHVVLNHRNSILVRQSSAEVKKQENEADEFARKYLENN